MPLMAQKKKKYDSTKPGFPFPESLRPSRLTWVTKGFTNRDSNPYKNWLTTVHYTLSTIHCPLSTVHYPLSTVHYPLSTVHYPLSTIHCPLYTIQHPTTK